VLLRYLGKLKYQKFAILMHVKHVSKCELSSSIQYMTAKYHENKCKDYQNAKYQHFVFCSFTVLKILKECLIAVWSNSDKLLITLHLTSGGMCPCRWWTFLTPFVNKLLQTICMFHVFLVQVASIHRVSFLLC